MAMYESPKRLYVTMDRSRVVDESDPEAAYLLVAEGGSLTEEEARQYGLMGGDAPTPEAPEAEAPAEEEADAKAKRPAANKAVTGPAENK
jgi:hypothetical protein